MLWHCLATDSQEAFDIAITSSHCLNIKYVATDWLAITVALS